jgi:ABC-type bacteriocin/lantibiotic exporter with double-glycine peptidase domain
MSNAAAALWLTLRQILTFVGFVARGFPLFFLVLALTALVLVLEYVATSLMIPLSSGAFAGQGLVTQAWHGLAEAAGLPASQRTWLWFFFLAMVLRLALGYLQTVLGSLLGKQVHRTLSGRIFQQVVAREPLAAVYTRSVGHYITLAGDDTFRAGTIIASLLQSLVGLCTASVALAVLYQFSVPVFVAVSLFLLFCAAMVLIVLRSLLRLNRSAVALSRELGTNFVEALNSLRSIRSLHGERFVAATYAAQIAAYVRMLFTMEAIKTGVKSLPAVVLLLIAAVAFRPGAEFSLSEASMFAGTVIVIRIFASLGQMITAGSQLLTDIRAVGDIRALTGASDPGIVPAGKQHGPEIRSLSFSHIDYGYAANEKVLHDLSFRFEYGKTYAIVGPSGSGKSTLADILLGLVPPQAGQVAVNDGQCRLDEVRGRIMLVEQQPKIFSTTVRENLLFGHEADDDLLWAALRMVDLQAHIRGLPRGLDTPLSYLGENLSGGQRQRIGIARALVRRPQVLILDEATSALDPATRALVVRNIREHLQQGILVFITHDGEIAELADERLVLQRHADASPRPA